MKQLVYLLRPTAIEWVLYTFGVILFLVMSQWDAILDALISDRVQPEVVESTGGIFSDNLDSFLGNFDNTGAAATLTTLIFWSAVGALVYMIIWGVINGFLDFYNDTTATSNYVQGQDTAREGRWHGYKGRLMFRGTSVVFGIFYILLFLQMLMPLWQELFATSVSKLGSLTGIAQFVLAVGGGIVSVHIFTILARLATLKLRVRGTPDFDALK